MPTIKSEDEHELERIKGAIDYISGGPVAKPPADPGAEIRVVFYPRDAGRIGAIRSQIPLIDQSLAFLPFPVFGLAFHETTPNHLAFWTKCAGGQLSVSMRVTLNGFHIR